jgi:hypothetical protein
MTEKLTRKEICTNAVNERWYPTIPKATHSGIINIAGKEIACDVLEDGRRVLRQSTFLNAMGKARAGGGASKRENDTKIPIFVSANNLTPYLTQEILDRGVPITYKSKDGKKLNGYGADVLPLACKVYCDADEAMILQERQKPIAKVCRLILQGLALLGITGLVDEATGFQHVRDKDELQKLLDKFIDKELQPWTKKFPLEFFNHIKRIYGLEELKRAPAFAGHLINRYIYNEISPEILDELKKKNPVLESGKRKHYHHQLLTLDMGCPALEKQIIKINTLMSLSESKDDFDKYFEKSKSR